MEIDGIPAVAQVVEPIDAANDRVNHSQVGGSGNQTTQYPEWDDDSDEPLLIE